jgi:hypothetical protein
MSERGTQNKIGAVVGDKGMIIIYHDELPIEEQFTITDIGKSFVICEKQDDYELAIPNKDIVCIHRRDNDVYRIVYDNRVGVIR